MEVSAAVSRVPCQFLRFKYCGGLHRSDVVRRRHQSCIIVCREQCKVTVDEFNFICTMMLAMITGHNRHLLNGHAVRAKY